MSSQNFTTSFSVDQSPKDVFDAINNPRGWWSEEIEGGTDQVGDEFNYHFQDLHRCKIRVTDLIPGQKVSWLVVENYFSFTEDKTEWTDTTINFDISEEDGTTTVVFTHVGLVPEYECYGACSEGWGNYINTSLRGLITAGAGLPNATGQARTTAEAELGAS
ncbi:SRPBCC family protein [Jatrophihabitans sp.]|uniref:SRPBCC family protein n=1 Tax=Jatrophihabitans sp. TaxID=1932789 RepID=UPI002F0F4C21